MSRVAAPAHDASRRIALRVPRRLQGLVSVLALLGLLQLASVTGVLPARDFPPVFDDLRALADQVATGRFWHQVGLTLEAWALGLAIASAIGVALGVLIGSSELLYGATRGIVEFLRPIPSVALIPLAVLVYGTGLKSELFLAVFASTWPILVQSTYGVHDVDPVAMDTARAFGFGRVARLRSVALPSAVPYIATGLRLASATALILVVTAEIVIGSPGLGKELALAQSADRFDRMYAFIIALGLLGWLLNGVFQLLERRVLHWHPSQRAAEAGA